MHGCWCLIVCSRINYEFHDMFCLSSSKKGCHLFHVFFSKKSSFCNSFHFKGPTKKVALVKFSVMAMSHVFLKQCSKNVLITTVESH